MGSGGVVAEVGDSLREVYEIFWFDAEVAASLRLGSARHPLSTILLTRSSTATLVFSAGPSPASTILKESIFCFQEFQEFDDFVVDCRYGARWVRIWSCLRERVRKRERVRACERWCSSCKAFVSVGFCVSGASTCSSCKFARFRCFEYVGWIGDGCVVVVVSLSDLILGERVISAISVAVASVGNESGDIPGS